MAKDPRVQKNIESLRALKKTISWVVANPVPYAGENELHAALESQGAMARYGSVDRGIFPSSINTLKRIADLILEGGFAELDDLRRTALNACVALRDKNGAPKKTRRAELELKLQRVISELQVSHQDNWILTMAFDRSLKQGKYYASQSGDALLLALCLREQEELRAMFNLRRPYLTESGN